MTERVPQMPSEFNCSKPQRMVRPDPRTVRSSDMTWFNTSGEYIIKNDYNTCTQNRHMEKYKYGMLTEPVYHPFELRPWGGKKIPGNPCNLMTPRFNIYGHNYKCYSAVSNCGCNGKINKGCPIYEGTYIDPN